MTGGLAREQIGVTESMIETFGEMIFDLSHNVQVRHGDPIRKLDFAAIETQRADLGLSDQEISAKIGLSDQQVTFIRNIVERRHIRTDKYHRLNKLGGTKRFRKGRFVAPEEVPTMRPEAMNLKAAMSFDPERAKFYLDQGYWQNDTISSWLARNAKEKPDHQAIVSDSETLTHSELWHKVRQTAAGLHKLGVGKGDVVSVQLPNIPEYLICYYAIAALGAVMSTIYMPHRAKEMEGLLSHNNARAVICPAEIGSFKPAANTLKMKDRLPCLDHVIVFGESVDSSVALDEVMSADAGAIPDNHPVAADPFLLLYTSGTTANPKGVPLSYHNMLSNARLGAPEHGLTGDDRILSAAPFGHLFGLYSAHLALAVGATIVLLPVFTPPDLGRVVATFQPTALFTAPAHIAACFQTGVFESSDFTSLKLAILSGSAVPPDLAAAFAEKMPNGKVTQLWGMTETQAGLYTRPGDPAHVIQSSAGKPSPGTEARLMTAENAMAAPGEEGELQVRGNLLFPGYYNNPEANAAAFTDDGWFRSGDLARMDEAGFITITGRIKDIINRGGIKYNPLDIEDLLGKHPKIAQAAIVPFADAVLGERACVFVTLTGAHQLSLEEVCTYLTDSNIAKLKHPEKLVILDEMPLTATRKIIKGRLKIDG